MGLLGFIQTILRPKATLSNSETVTKSDSSWAKVFETGQYFNNIYGQGVSNPYRQVSSVFKAVKAIADNVLQAELIFKDYSTEKEIFPTELIELFENPNPLMSGKDFIQAVTGFFALYGECFIVKQSKNSGGLSVGQATGSKLPDELWVFNPKKFTEIKEGNIITGWRYDSQKFNASEVIHIKDWNPDSLHRSLDPTIPIQDIIDIDWKSLLYNKAFFTNDATPGNVLSTDQRLNKETVDRLIEVWEKRHKGASKAFRTAVLDSGLKAEKTGSDHTEMQYYEGRKNTREEILGIWRVPKMLFSYTDDLNYATFIGQKKIFWTETIIPILMRIASSLNTHLINKWDKNIYVEFDLSNVNAFQEDFKDKVNTAKELFAMGFTANEINEKLQLGFEPKPWRDKWWVPFTLAPAGEAHESELYEEPKDEPKKDEPKKTKQSKLGSDVVWKRFLQIHTPIENKFAPVLKKYFYEQRKRALESIKKVSQSNDLYVKLKKDAQISINWQFENDELTKLAKPYLLAGINQGIDFAKGYIDQAIQSRLAEDMLLQRVASYLNVRGRKITQINETIRKQISNQITEAVRAGETITEISERVRRVYNMAGNRSRVIARTETTGALNGGSTLYYDAVGVDKKEWASAGDEAVRDSHASLNGDIVGINQRFSNGLDFPGGDGPPEETINCRCTIIPVVE